MSYVLSSCPTRAPRELDGHQGDSAGGDGVQCEVPGYDSGGPAQRRGHGFSCHSQNCCHGESLAPFWLTQPYNGSYIDSDILRSLLDKSCILYMDFIVSTYDCTDSAICKQCLNSGILSARSAPSTATGKFQEWHCEDFNYSDAFYRNSLVDLWNYSLKLQCTLFKWLKGEYLSDLSFLFWRPRTVIWPRIAIYDKLIYCCAISTV